jgi:hypothetical protein
VCDRREEHGPHLLLSVFEILDLSNIAAYDEDLSALRDYLRLNLYVLLRILRLEERLMNLLHV